MTMATLVARTARDVARDAVRRHLTAPSTRAFGDEVAHRGFVMASTTSQVIVAPILRAGRVGGSPSYSFLGGSSSGRTGSAGGSGGFLTGLAVAGVRCKSSTTAARAQMGLSAASKAASASAAGVAGAGGAAAAAAAASTSSSGSATGPGGVFGRALSVLRVYHDLSKFKLSAFVVSTAAAGYVLGSGPEVNWEQLGWTSLGTMLCSSAANTFNQVFEIRNDGVICLLYTSPSPRDATLSRMPSSA